MSPNTRKILAFGGGACVLVGGLTGFPFNTLFDILVSVPLALGTIGGLWLVTAPKEAQAVVTSGLANMATAGQNIDSKEVIDAITTGSNKLAEIRKAAKDIRAPNTQRRIQKICEIGDKIVEDFRVDPKDVKLARSWLNTYLDQTLEIVRQYAQLSRTGARNLEAQKIMVECEDTLDLIAKKFQELLDKLLANDVMDLDVNQTVLRNMLNQEGV